MRLNYILAPLTVLLFIVTIINIASHVQSRRDAAVAETNTGVEDTAQLAPENLETSILAQSTSLLMTGVSSRVPTVEDYSQLDSVPWEFKEINRLFRSAGTERSCQLLEPGIDVVQPLAKGVKGQAIPLGRRSAFGIRLQIGKEMGSGLPGISRGYIEDYLKSHQLMIQPSFYQDGDGKVFPGPDMRAALYKVEGPYLTALQEEMIKTSVGDLRTLGAYWQKGKDFNASSIRTLILAFFYEKDPDRGAVQPVPEREFELIFLHLLPDATPDDPKLCVFATSDGRTQFHLLEETDPDQPEQPANVNADIRFADVQLLGMLPRLPVVTRVKHRSLLTVPVEMVKAEIEGLAGKPPEHGLSSVLDDFYARALGVDMEYEPGKAEANNGATDDQTPSNASAAQKIDSSGTPGSLSLPKMHQSDPAAEKKEDENQPAEKSDGDVQSPSKRKKSGKKSFDA